MLILYTKSTLLQNVIGIHGVNRTENIDKQEIPAITGAYIY